MRYLILLLLALSQLTFAQDDLANIINEIEANNSGLKTMELAYEAEQLAHRTGVLPANPELGVNLLNGGSRSSGTRTDFSISQSFDFPTVYSHKSKIADARDEQSRLKLEDYKLRLRMQSRALLLQVIYHNKRIEKLDLRAQQAAQTAAAFQQMLDLGKTNRIEANKAAMHAELTQQSKSREKIFRDQVLAELQAMNGGKAISLEVKEYPLTKLNRSFESWVSEVLASNPVLQIGENNIAIQQKEEKLSRARSLPKFNAGYMSEKASDEHFQGVTLGVSVPLWENKNQVKLAKAQTELSKQQQEDLHIQFYYHIKAVFERAQSFQSIYINLQQALDNYSTLPLLEKALNHGEISLLSYFDEIALFYEYEDQLFESELEYIQAASELAVYENL